MVRTKDYKPTAAIAIGTLLLDRRSTKRKHDPARSALVQLVDKVNHLQPSTLERGRVLKGLLEYSVPAMQVIMSRGRVSDLLAGTSPSSWRADDTDRLKYLSRFGNVATRQLLKASRGSSLKTRYNLSQLLSLLPRESHEVLRESASNVSTDLDQRRTAILALGKIRDRESVPLIEGLLNDKVLRGSVIDALANIGTENAINAIRKLKQTLETAGHADLRQEVWISKIEAGLSNTRD